jgi:hypothetical protein
LAKKNKVPSEIKHIVEYHAPEIDWRYQKLISYSQFSIYKTCPLRWYLQYKEKHKVFTDNIHNVFGTAIHEAIQHYLTVMYNVSTAAADREDIIGMFENRYRELYKEKYKKNNNKHFSSAEEMGEFYEDGVNILDYFKKNKTKYFSKRGYHLVGCEVPIHIIPDPSIDFVIYQGHLDIVLYHEPTQTHEIIDIKTSTRGWSDYEKKDELKPSQVVLYKKYYSEQYKVPEDKISVKYFILKRKLPVDPKFHISRIQEFSPSSGKIKMKKVSQSFSSFIKECFHQEPSPDPKPSPSNCRFCPFSKNTKLCGKGIYV